MTIDLKTIYFAIFDKSYERIDTEVCEGYRQIAFYYVSHNSAGLKVVLTDQ